MALASDGKGNFLSLGADGAWAPAQRARNPETGAELVLDGSEWKPLPGAPEPARQSTGIGAALRGVARSATFGLIDEARAGLDALRGGNYDESLRQSRAQFQADDKEHPLAAAAGQIYGGVGGAMAGGAAVGASRVMGMVPNALAPAARVVGGGALAGGATAFGEGSGGLQNRLDDASTGALVGGAVGAGVGAVAGGIGRVIAPVRPNLTVEQQALRQAAQNEGIPLSVAQETGSRNLKNMEAALAQLPGSAGMEANAQQAQQRAFNAAVLGRAGIQADVATPAVLNPARQQIGGEIGAIANRNTLRVTPDLEARLAQIEDNLRFVPGESGPGGHSMHPGPVGARLDKVREMMQPDAANGGGMLIPGAAYRQMDSDLGKAVRSASDGDRREALQELRQTLRGAMDNSISPQDAADWARARRQYANLNVAADAASSAGAAAAEGSIPPLALRGAVQRSVGREAFKWGGGDLHELANLGQSVLRQPPDSGTAGRSVMNALLTGSAPAAGGVAGMAAAGPVGMVAGAAAPFVLPAAVQSFINSRVGRAWLTNALAPNAVAGLAAGTPAAAVTAGGLVERNRLLND